MRPLMSTSMLVRASRGVWSRTRVAHGFCPYASAAHRLAFKKTIRPRLCHSEHSRGIWLQIGHVPGLSADPSTALRFAQDDKHSGRPFARRITHLILSEAGLSGGRTKR